MKYVHHQEIIRRFGGVRALAKALGHKNASTVQGWYERACIPTRRQSEILGLAAKTGTRLTPSDFFDVDGVTATEVCEPAAVMGAR